MEKIYVFLATGFEDIEALGIIDVCRRAALPVVTISVTGEKTVMSSHHVGIVADALFEETDFGDAKLLFLPGGMPGSTNLAAHEGLRQVILNHYKAGKLLAAICAAPLVYGRLGLLQGLKATIYPGMESELQGAQATGALVQEDGQFILGKGPAAALQLGYTIVRRIVGEKKAEEIKSGMIYADAIQAGC